MGSSKQTQTSSATPYSAIQPALNSQAQMTSNYLQNRDPAEQAAANASRDYYSSVVNGDYLNAGNPYVQGVIDDVKANVMPSVNGTFSSAGLDGSTLHQGMLAKALTQGMAQPLFANYQNERGMQQNAAAALPGAAVQASDLGAVSNTLPITDSFRPYATQTQTSQVKQPLWQQIAGGALAGAALLGAPATGGSSLSLLGAANAAAGNPLQRDMGMHDWDANTYVNGVRAPWVQYY